MPNRIENTPEDRDQLPQPAFVVSEPIPLHHRIEQVCRDWCREHHQLGHPLLIDVVEQVGKIFLRQPGLEVIDHPAHKEEKAEDKKYQQAAQDIRQTQQTEDEAFQAAVKDQQDAACRAANARLSKYKSARKLYRERSDGEREYLNDAELDAERAEAARAVDELCG